MWSLKMATTFGCRFIGSTLSPVRFYTYNTYTYMTGKKVEALYNIFFYETNVYCFIKIERDFHVVWSPTDLPPVLLNNGIKSTVDL